MRATIADLRVQVDKLVEMIDLLESLPDDFTQAPAHAPEQAQERCLQKVRANGATKRKQLPKRELGVPRFCTTAKGKSIDVCRELPQPFSVADLSRQANIVVGSATNALSRWQAKGWVQGHQGSWTRTPSFPAGDVVVKKDESQPD